MKLNTIIKIMWYQHKDRHVGQVNKNQNPEINAYIYGHFFFKEFQFDKVIQWVKAQSFQQTLLG